MRKERVLLKEVADSPVLRRQVFAPLRVEQHRPIDADPSPFRPEQPGDDAECCCLSAPEGPTRASVSPAGTLSSADATKLRRG